MSHAFDLKIAGLRLSVDCPPNTRIVHYNPLYRDFIDSAAASDLEIRVEISLEPEPEHRGLPLLFDTGETWKAYRIGEDILLRLPNPAEAGYFWTFRLKGDFSEATVYCSPLMIEDGVEGPVCIINPVHYPLDQLLAMFHFSIHRGLIVHAAGIARKEAGIFCAGRSGAGKTTLMRQWRDAPGIRGLSDDRIIVREIEGVFRLFGTPWAGDGKIAAADEVDLRAMAFIHHSEENRIEPIAPGLALQQLLPTSSILWFHRGALERSLALAHNLVEKIPCFNIHCKPDPSAIELIDQLLD